MEMRPPSQPSSASTSSSSTPSMSTLTTDDRAKSPLNTSPSGRVTFIFPQLHKPSARAVPKGIDQSSPLIELPTADTVSTSETSPSETGRVIVGPGRLRLVTNDALTSMFGRPSNRAPPVYGQGRDNVQAWIESSKRATISDHKRDEEGA